MAAPLACPTIDAAPVVELRQYTLRPGRRDELVELFEAELMEPQEASGMCLGGLFRDLDHPDRFVWQRGFADMCGRQQALADFYGGPVWKVHAAAANATMIDSDDVLLLRPTDPPHPPEPPAGSADEVGMPGVVALGVVTYLPDTDRERRLTELGHAALRRAFGVPVAAWRTEPATNTFPGLPVRPDHAFVWQATFADGDRMAEALARFDVDDWWAGATDALGEHHENRLRLAPTVRSRHPGP